MLLAHAETVPLDRPEDPQVVIPAARARSHKRRVLISTGALVTAAALVAGVLASPGGTTPGKGVTARPTRAVATARISNSRCPTAPLPFGGATDSSSANPFRVLGTYLLDRSQVYRTFGYVHDVRGPHLWTMCSVTGAGVTGNPPRSMHYALWLFIRRNVSSGEVGEFEALGELGPVTVRLSQSAPSGRSVVR